MNLNEDKEQNQNVEAKYLDPETGFDIKIKQDKLYQIKKKDRKKIKIVKPVSENGFRGSESTFSELDRYSPIMTTIDDEFQGELFLVDNYMDSFLDGTELIDEDY